MFGGDNHESQLISVLFVQLIDEFELVGVGMLCGDYEGEGGLLAVYYFEEAGELLVVVAAAEQVDPWEDLAL